MSIPQTTIQNVLTATDIVSVVSEYINLKKVGANYRARCPFHNEKTPSFYVNSEKQIFHCFGCNTGGNAISFLMKIEGLSYPEAIRKLALKKGIEIREENSEFHSFDSDEKDKIYKVLEEACLFFQKHLENNEVILKWLKNRGIDKNSIEKFRIGFSPSSGNALLDAAVKKGYSADILKKAGVISSGRDFFFGRVIFPIFDITGRVIAFGGRALNDKTMPKYLNSSETMVYSKSRVLYGMNFAGKAIKEQGSATLLEGYIDVVVCHQHGLTSTVAALGTAFSQQHSLLLKRYTDSVIVAYDSDSAGRASAVRTADILLSDDFQIKIACLPEGKDSDDVLLSDGAAKLKSIFSKAKSYIDFIIDEKSAVCDPGTIDGKRRLAGMVLPVIYKIPNSIVQSEYIKVLSERLKVKSEFLILEMAKTRRSFVEQAVARSVTPENETFKKEMNLLTVIAGDLALADCFTDIAADVFTSQPARDIYDLLLNLKRKGKKSVTCAELIDIAGPAANVTDNLMNDFIIANPHLYVKKYRKDVIRRIETKHLKSLNNKDLKERQVMSQKMKGSQK